MMTDGPCCRDVKEELVEAVFMPMQYPELFRGIRRPPRYGRRPRHQAAPARLALTPQLAGPQGRSSPLLPPAAACRTFMLYGPPGTGKTMLVEKVSAEGGLTLLALSPSTVLSKWWAAGRAHAGMRDSPLEPPGRPTSAAADAISRLPCCRCCQERRL